MKRKIVTTKELLKFMSEEQYSDFIIYLKQKQKRKTIGYSPCNPIWIIAEWSE